MNTKNRSNFNRFGKIGKIVTTVLLITAVVMTFLSCTAAIYTATLPKDAVRISVTNHAGFKISKSAFSSVWGILTNSNAYASGSDPSDLIKDDGSKPLPPDTTEIDTELKFFDQSYSSATIRSEGNDKIIDAKSSPAEYHSSDLITLLIFTTLFCASAAAVLLMLQMLFKVLSVCESPFCMDFVSKLRTFGYSLLPVAVFASIGDTLAVRFLSAGKNAGISVQWGVLVTFAVTMCLVAVFRYGVQLQKESDETL